MCINRAELTKPEKPRQKRILDILYHRFWWKERYKENRALIEKLVAFICENDL